MEEQTQPKKKDPRCRECDARYNKRDASTVESWRSNRFALGKKKRGLRQPPSNQITTNESKSIERHAKTILAGGAESWLNPRAYLTIENSSNSKHD